MFCWGGYSFQSTSSADLPDKPPLRYPVYVPPPPHLASLSHPESGSAEPAELCASMVDDIHRQRIKVHHLACGNRHALAVISIIAESNDSDLLATEVTPPVLVGIGNNQHGQLGPHIPGYTTTLTPLKLEQRFFSSSKSTTVGAEGVIASIACGHSHSLVLTRQGDVFACGSNEKGQLGTGNVSAAGKAGLSDTDFKLLHFSLPIQRVFASGNVSYAIDTSHRLYSWGDPQFGQLALGEDGERIDVHTLKSVIEPVRTPTLVEWFSSRHISITQVSAGKNHMACSSKDGELYTVGTGTFGKLGVGDTERKLLPSRVSFPSKHPEELIDFACGDEHTLVLRKSPLVGSVVYFFGKCSNGDGQLTPTIVTFPAWSTPSPAAPLLSAYYHYQGASAPSTSIVKVYAGKGTQCAAVSRTGVVWVWGKHSQTSVANGTPASVGKTLPSVVTSLLPFSIEGLSLGGTMLIAHASHRKPLVMDGESLLNQESMDSIPPAYDYVKKGWEVAIPHDDRVGLATGRAIPLGDTVALQYEAGVREFLTQYFGGATGFARHRLQTHQVDLSRLEGLIHDGSFAAAYIAQLPEAPPLRPLARSKFARKRTRELMVGDKIRVWMSDVYALGTVAEILEKENKVVNEYEEIVKEGDFKREQSPFSAGVRLRVDWLRDDWAEEVLSLYSDDETMASGNVNRWQPLWFEKNEDGSLKNPS